jgi:hypothetical protein
MAGRSDQAPATHNERRCGQRPEHPDQVPARRRGLRSRHHGQVPARCRGQRPGRHDQVTATLNERHRGQRPGYHDQVPREPKRGHGQQLGQGPLHKGWAQIPVFENWLARRCAPSAVPLVDDVVETSEMARHNGKELSYPRHRQG